LGNGWIRLYRELLDKQVFQNEKLLKTLIWCLLKARRFPENVKIGQQTISLQAGQFYTGRFNAAEELQMKPSTAWKNILLLKKNQSIDIKSNNKFSVITVVNWALYQSEEIKSDTKRDNKITTKEQQNNTNKKDKKDKKVESVLKDLYGDFVLLTKDQYKKLVERFGLQDTLDRIERLNNYGHQKPKNFAEYKSHYHTILNWADMDVKRNNGQAPRKSGSTQRLPRAYESLREFAEEGD
jgi:hypothetical protein